MESSYPSPKSRNQPISKNNIFHNNPTSPAQSPMSSTSSMIRFNQTPVRNNRLLDRIRTQLTNIKSQVFKMAKDQNSPSKSNDRMQKSLSKQSVKSKYQSRSPTQPTQYDLNYYIYENQALNRDLQLLKQKIQQKQQEHINQKTHLTDTLVDLQRQLQQKDRKFEEYENEIHYELERFKQEVISHTDANELRSRICALENDIDEMSNELIYLRKRTSEDIIEIRRLTIENHELKKCSQLLESKIGEQKTKQRQNKLSDRSRFSLDFDNHRRHTSQQKVRTQGSEQFKKLRQQNESASEQLLLQQNTINVLETQLSKAIKQNKKIEARGEEQLKNAKITYQKLLQSVKQGLAQCYKSQIQDLRIQLSQYTSINNSESDRGSQQHHLDYQRHHLPPPPSRTQPKPIPEITSQIIILQQDQSLQQTQRKGITPQNQLLSYESTARDQLRKRVQYLQNVIQGLQQQIQQFKWNQNPTQTPPSKQLNKQPTPQLISKLETMQKQRDQIFYNSIVKQYTLQLQDTLISSIVEQQLLTKNSLQSISSEMQYVIEKLKIRNYQVQKKLQQTQQQLKLKTQQIQELKKQLDEMQTRQSEQTQINEIIITKVHALEQQNERLNSLKDIQNERSENKLKQINHQIMNLNKYKTELEEDISKRQDRMKTLKEQIASIVDQEDKKRNSMKIKDKRNSKGDENIQKQLEIQAEYFQNIIKNMTNQLKQLKQNSKKKNSESSRDDTIKVKQLKSEITKKNEEIFQIKNQTAVSRLRCDSLKSQQQVQRINWATEKKNLEIKLERQIQNLLRDLSLQRQTVQFLTAQMKSLEYEIAKKDEIILSKTFSRNKLRSSENQTISTKIAKQQNEKKSYVFPQVDKSTDKSKRSSKVNMNKSMTPLHQREFFSLQS